MIVVKLPSVVSFEWDKGNEQKNWLKHKVTAEEAFDDEKRLILEDTKHSEQEARYILFGKTDKGRMLFIIYTLRNENKKVRIISARDVNRKEVQMPPQFGTFKQAQRVQQSDAEQAELGFG